MLVAPLRQPPQGQLAGASPHEDLPFWLVRWLLFRLMFASGVVKLTSRCPAWWGLTGEHPRPDTGQSWSLCMALTARCHLQPSLTTTRRSACPHRPPGLPTTCPSGCTSSAWWPPSSSRSPCHLCSSCLLGACAWLPSTLRWVGPQPSGRQVGRGLLPHYPAGLVGDRVAAATVRKASWAERRASSQAKVCLWGREQLRWGRRSLISKGTRRAELGSLQVVAAALRPGGMGRG